LKSKEGLKVIYDLVAKSDVVLENFRPGAAKGMGLDYDTLRSRRPEIIYCSINGFGSDGPWARKPAFDAIIQAMSGAMFATGESDRPPALMTVNIGDLAASCCAASAILAALHARGRGLGGTRIDMSMMDTMLFLMPFHTQIFLQTGYVVGRHGSGYGPRSIAGGFQTSDGKFVQVLCPYPKFQESLMKVIAEVPGFAGFENDPRFAGDQERMQNNAEFLELARKAFLHRTQAEWLDILAAAEVPHGPIMNVGEALESEQAVARGLVTTVDAPEFKNSYKTLASPFHTADSSPPTGPRKLAPFAADTRKVLGAFLGYPDAKIDELISAGAILPPAS
jgi:crotonobetainyl-CoA:carnitine CoA-transferase CaiB-like acyl-CoA transferase